MKGNPKYQIGDKVIVEVNGENHVGEIYIIDPEGTWDDPDDVSYDIMIHDFTHPVYPDKPGDCLVKHCTEKTVKLYKNE